MSDQALRLMILAIVALLCMIGLGVLFWSAWQKLRPLDDDVSSPLLQRQLALGAMYAASPPRDEKRLSGWRDKSDQADICEMLGSTWGIAGPRRKQAMVDEMNAGLGRGHRTDPDLLELAQRLARTDGAGDDAPRRAAKALLAWDVARYADLLRHGFYVGYLSREQALAFLQQADELSRAHYASWAEFGEAFIFAKRVFDSQLTPAEREHVSNIEHIRAKVRALLDDPDSVWRRNPWR